MVQNAILFNSSFILLVPLIGKLVNSIFRDFTAFRTKKAFVILLYGNCFTGGQTTVTRVCGRYDCK